MRRPSSSRTPSNHGFISRCTAPARPFPECINGLGCKLYRPRGEIPIREPFRSVYRWISNSVVRTPLTVLRTALRFNGKSRKTIGGIDSIHFVFLPFLSSSFIIFFFLFSFFFFDYSDIRIEVSFCHVCIVRKLFSRGSFCLLLKRGEGEREEGRKEYFFDSLME